MTAITIRTTRVLLSSIFALSLFDFLVVVFVSDFYIAREGMLHAYDEGMINGDFIFIISELDQTQMAKFRDQPFKWFFSSFKQTNNRFHHVLEAFKAVFVLAVKSSESESYAKFTAEVKRRSTQAPFYSKVYTGYVFKDKRFPANKSKVIPLLNISITNKIISEGRGTEISS